MSSLRRMRCLESVHSIFKYTIFNDVFGYFDFFITLINCILIIVVVQFDRDLTGKTRPFSAPHYYFTNILYHPTAGGLLAWKILFFLWIAFEVSIKYCFSVYLAVKHGALHPKSTSWVFNIYNLIDQAVRAKCTMSNLAI